MELPAQLRAAVDGILAGIPLADLQQAAARISRRYRSETRDGVLHLNEEMAVKAYLAARLPATYAAVRASLDAASIVLPAFEPKTLLDIGAGPGTALWAAAECWPSLETAVLVETSASARTIGRHLAKAGSVETHWVAADATAPLPDASPADLVTLAYVLDELKPAEIEPLLSRLWSLARGLLVVVEPGTPAGWIRILAVRRKLVEAGAHIVAPCPHAAPCPLAAPDWCHFSRRVARSRLHRLTKEADVPWEDEKFIYIAVSRQAVPANLDARIIAPPRTGSGQVRLKLCCADGMACDRLFSRRDGPAFKAARRIGWGDTFDAP